MKAISGGVHRVTHQNDHVVGPRGKHHGKAMKNRGVMDMGMDLSGDATNCIGGTKRTNKMLSPGPRTRRHGT
jgi:hypothetical protein